MKRKQIENRKDVYFLVLMFYEKIKHDEKISMFFLETIPEKKWEEHILKLTDFWESNLFFVKSYYGNPIEVHCNLNANFNYIIQQEHFGRWLQLWIATVNEYFFGTKANLAKERARSIASMLFFKLN